MLVLVVNTGSSSVKYELFEMDTTTALADGLAERVTVNGGVDARLIHRPAGQDPVIVTTPMPDHETALRLILDTLVAERGGVLTSLDQIKGVGHRVVHGAEHFSASVIIDEAVLQAIETCVPLAPLHNPSNLAGIRACRALMPDVPHVAVFDTAFHQTIPQHAFLYGLPYEMYEQRSIRRYGFHGTSHRYVAGRAAEMLAARGIRPEEQRLVTCHLGNGCSMTAVQGGKSVDTTMGFTPLEGLLMGTRCGDVDPAIVALLCGEHGDEETVYDLLNKQSGLLGISGVSSDMRDVEAAAVKGNERAAAALELFCYRVRKYIGAYAAAMGGLDAVVFTAGIGENSAEVRRRSIRGLEFLGLTIDEKRNADPQQCDPPGDITAADASVRTLVIPTNEELTIARDTQALIGGAG